MSGKAVSVYSACRESVTFVYGILSKDNELWPCPLWWLQTFMLRKEDSLSSRQALRCPPGTAVWTSLFWHLKWLLWKLPWRAAACSIRTALPGMGTVSAVASSRWGERGREHHHGPCMHTHRLLLHMGQAGWAVGQQSGAHLHWLTNEENIAILRILMPYICQVKRTSSRWVLKIVTIVVAWNGFFNNCIFALDRSHGVYNPVCFSEQSFG